MPNGGYIISKKSPGRRISTERFKESVPDSSINVERRLSSDDLAWRSKPYEERAAIVRDNMAARFKSDAERDGKQVTHEQVTKLAEQVNIHRDTNIKG